MSGLNIAALHEAIAEAVPDRDCIVWRDRTLSWSAVTDRTRRFAHGLLDRGIGGLPRLVDHGWESPHDHVALLLTNGNEYLEAMLGCWKARTAAINCNYRYTADELGHVLVDSGAIAIVYHSRFAPVVDDAIRGGSAVRHLIVVDDGSGVAPVDGSVAYEDLLAEASDARPALDWSGDDRYVVYTGGTTGLPKGVLWRQDDFLASALGITGSVAEVVDRAQRPDRPRALPAPPFMHGAAHWNAISCWLSGGTVVIQGETDRLDPSDVLDTCARERVGSMLIVGDAFARPLLDEQERRPRDLSCLRLLMTGGAVLSPATKHRVAQVLPSVRIIDVLGSSETGRHGIATSGDRHDDGTTGFVPSASTVVLDETRTQRLAPGEDADGWLAQRGRVPLGYLGDQEKSEETFPVVDGAVHAIAGDRARLAADGSLVLLGRESVTINTGGEKVHAEEVEQVLKGHPGVYDALVVGRPSERWGQEVVAVISSHSPVGDDDLVAHASGHLARFKLPKQVVRVDEIRRSASGKPDYAWARAVAIESEPIA